MFHLLDDNHRVEKVQLQLPQRLLYFTNSCLLLHASHSNDFHHVQGQFPNQNLRQQGPSQSSTQPRTQPPPVQRAAPPPAPPTTTQYAPHPAKTEDKNKMATHRALEHDDSQGATKPPAKVLRDYHFMSTVQDMVDGDIVQAKILKMLITLPLKEIIGTSVDLQKWFTGLTKTQRDYATKTVNAEPTDNTYGAESAHIEETYGNKDFYEGTVEATPVCSTLRLSCTEEEEMEDIFLWYSLVAEITDLDVTFMDDLTTEFDTVSEEMDEQEYSSHFSKHSLHTDNDILYRILFYASPTRLKRLNRVPINHKMQTLPIKMPWPPSKTTANAHHYAKTESSHLHEHSIDFILTYSID